MSREVLDSKMYPKLEIIPMTRNDTNEQDSARLNFRLPIYHQESAYIHDDKCPDCSGFWNITEYDEFCSLLLQVGRPLYDQHKFHNSERMAILQLNDETLLKLKNLLDGYFKSKTIVSEIEEDNEIDNIP